MLRSLRWRLLLTLIGVVVIAVGTAALYASRTTARAFERYLERDAQRNQQVLSTLRSFLLEDEAARDYNELAQTMRQHLGERFILTDGDGMVLADSDLALLGQRLEPSTEVAGAVFSIEPTWATPAQAAFPPDAPGKPGDRLLYSADAPFDHAPAGAYITISGPSEPVVAQWTRVRIADPISAAFLDTVNRSLLLAAAVAGIAALVLTLTLGRRILEPIAVLTDAARRLERGERVQRVPVRSNDEIGVLGSAFNSMADGLQRQEQLRRNLVSDVAHELRTPLTNIRGYLEAVRDGVAEPNDELVASLHEEAVLLNHLIDDLQELALAEAGQLRLHRRPTALGETVHSAVRAMQPAAGAKGVSVSADVPPDLPPVNADAERIGQVLRNLLSNAVTHTPPGGMIGVKARAVDGELVLSVTDNGSGIPPQHLAHIWERFYRADRSRVRATGGAGLGLAIVRQLVLAHGGSVNAQSEVGQGSTFSVRLPRE